jgi:hypothetical protein
MPPSAFALLGFFVAVALGTGAGATAVVGPRRPAAALAPVAAAFVGLYLVGHRLGLSFGPSVRLFGFDVALAWDVAVAIAAALATALAQRTILRRRAALRTSA